jgi:hypothetical protein
MSPDHIIPTAEVVQTPYAYQKTRITTRLKLVFKLQVGYMEPNMKQTRIQIGNTLKIMKSHVQFAEYHVATFLWCQEKTVVMTTIF